MPDPNRKETEPKIALSPPALFALAAVIFFLAGGIFAYVQLIGRGLQKTSTSSSPYLSQDQTTPLSTPSATAVQTPTATPIPKETPVSTPTPVPTTSPTSVTPPETPASTAEPTATETATPAETLIQPSETPSASPTETSNPEAQASASAQAFPTVKYDAAEEAEVRKEVLARIDLLKELSQKERDYLYAQVERARGFTKLAIIPFPSGKTHPEQFQIDHLLSYLQKPEYQKLYEDPTVVFVVAGYADKQGNEGQNMEISKQRAQLVAKILETQAKIANTIRAVGLGGSEFFGHGTPDKNRVVEIWLAAP
ncbi:MAG: OmpA family protein [Verrucomicrobia bacterium]|nr:OmpA family protein [Verrucomicrobiota bacterium]MBV8276259.1 OmpA family protein [Verrucomicrobiota bacterium]